MNFGTLRLTFPEGETREFPLTQPVVAIGRSQTNHLLLDHPSVSRHHARLTVTEVGLLIEDLESGNGTFVDRQRLTPNAPTSILATQTLRLGEVTVRYAPPPGGLIPAHRMSAANDTPVLPAININLSGPSQPVLPGQAVSVRLTVHNHEQETDDFVVRVSGTPAEWATITPNHLPLLPDQLGEVAIVFQPPHQPDVAPQAHLFYVTVLSRQHQTGLSEPGTLTVLPYHECAASLDPEQSRGEFKLQVTNLGNVEATYAISGEDEAEALLIEAAEVTFTLAPGAQMDIAMRARPKEQLPRGAPNPYPFTVHVTAQPPATGTASVAGKLSLKTGPLAWLTK